MPIPYLGSKRRSAQKIYDFISSRHPKGTLVDLFCGGLAVGEIFLKNGWNVIANDKNRFVVALLRKMTEGGLPKEIEDEFVSREKFLDVLCNQQVYPDWYVGYVMCIWSFGNNQKGYLFGRNTEPYKLAGHNLVVFKDSTKIEELMPDIPKSEIADILKIENQTERRLELRRMSVRHKTRIFELERLQQLERLERLQQLEQLEQLELYSEDYQGIEIPQGAIIYCDPPYLGRASYQVDDFEHDTFWEWARSQQNPIYVSEYQAPEDFVKVLEWKQNSTLQGGNNKAQPNECVFTKA
jgi:hypothetical protein